MTGRRGFIEICRHIRWDFFELIGSVIAIWLSTYLVKIPFSYQPFYLLFTASYLLASWFLAANYLKKYDKFNAKFEKLLSGVYEFVSAIKTVKAFHLNSFIKKKAVHLEHEGQKAS